MTPEPKSGSFFPSDIWRPDEGVPGGWKLSDMSCQGIKSTFDQLPADTQRFRKVPCGWVAGR
jgi:hypothetical protein